MILLLVVLLFLCVVAYALFAPVLLEIDSRHYIYRLSVAPIFRIWWATDDLLGHPKMSIFGIRKKLSFSKSKKRKVKKKKKKKRSSLFKLTFNRTLGIIKSFKVIKCYVDIDTGDTPLNGKLFPLMFLLSRISGKSFYINFTGKNEVVITIKNNAYRVLRAYIINH